MRTSTLFMMAAAILLASCGKEPAEPKPFPTGTWRTTHQYYRLEITPKLYVEELKELGWAEEREISIDVSEAEGYTVVFTEDGTGYGSGLRYEEEGRHIFEFTWQPSGEKLDATVTSESIGREYVDRFYWLSPLGFEIEESSADKMVLIWRYEGIFDNFNGGGPRGWTEDYTYRYILERVK